MKTKEDFVCGVVLSVGVGGLTFMGCVLLGLAPSTALCFGGAAFFNAMIKTLA
jgi:hypothetical protein